MFSIPRGSRFRNRGRESPIPFENTRETGPDRSFRILETGLRALNGLHGLRSSRRPRGTLRGEKFHGRCREITIDPSRSAGPDKPIRARIDRLSARLIEIPRLASAGVSVGRRALSRRRECHLPRRCLQTMAGNHPRPISTRGCNDARDAARASRVCRESADAKRKTWPTGTRLRRGPSPRTRQQLSTKNA